MARILFAWELGAGMGHVAPYLPLIKKLRKNGHQVAFALRNLQFAETTLGAHQIPYFQAPVMLGKAKDEIKAPHTFAQILHNVGYENVDELAGLAKAWRQLFDQYRPDLILYDHSPTALLASRGLKCKKIILGTGFFIPPDVSPLPILRKQPKPDLAVLAADEKRIHANINQVLQRLGSAPIERISQLYEADEQVLLTFRELDHYIGRQGTKVNYWGISNPSMGIAPVWPKGEGKHIYAYLKPFNTIPALLHKLKQLQTPTLIYAPEVDNKIKKEFSCDTLHFVEAPLDLRKIANSCDVAITNANHATVITLLLAGIPQLLLPLHFEQSLVAENIERMGAGLSAPMRHPEGMAMKLQAVLTEPRFKEGARNFAKRYSKFNAVAMENLLFDRVSELAG